MNPAKKSAVDVAQERAAAARAKILKENLKKAQVARLRYLLELCELGFGEKAMMDRTAEADTAVIRIIELTPEQQTRAKEAMQHELAQLVGLVVEPPRSGLVDAAGEAFTGAEL